jgi:hypothetical protein
MSLIVAGTFPDQAHAVRAIEALLQSGIDRDAICEFAVNPPGQHAGFPVGGDHYSSAGAETGGAGAAKGAVIGGAVGLGVGLAVSPFTGPAGPAGGAALGAYVGSLTGAVNNLGEESEKTGEPDLVAPTRPAGVLVAVHAQTTPAENLALSVLRERNAHPIERKLGTWRNGMWVDFDPTTPPEEVSPDDHTH